MQILGRIKAMQKGDVRVDWAMVEGRLKTGTVVVGVGTIREGSTNITSGARTWEADIGEEATKNMGIITTRRSRKQTVMWN